MAGRLTSTPPALSALVDGAEWRRSDVGESGSDVWRLNWTSGDQAYLKVGLGRVADAIADEAARLRWLAHRLPVPLVRLFVATPEQAWLLTDACAGMTGDAWLARDPGALPAIVRGCAALIRRWHAIPAEECPFEAGHPLRLAQARRNVSEGLVDTEDFDDDHAGWTAEAMLAKVEALASFTPERVFTHGDLSLGDLMFGPEGCVSGCIDVGLAGLADPYQDIAIFWNDLGQFGPEWQALFIQELGIPIPDPCRLEFHRCLNELF